MSRALAGPAPDTAPSAPRWLLPATRIVLAALVLPGAAPVLFAPAATAMARAVWCLALLEAGGAVLLPLRRTARIGSALCLAVYAAAIVLHIGRGLPWVPFAFASVAFALVLGFSPRPNGPAAQRDA